MKKLSFLLIPLILAGCSSYAPSAATKDITEKAVSLKDKTICESLQDSAAKASCVNTVTDTIQADAAFATGDLKSCAVIKDAQYKKACELAATSKERAQVKAKEENDKLQKAQNGTSLAACDALETDSAKDQCQTSVLSKMAYDQKDPKICLRINGAGAIRMCQSSIGVAVK